MRLFENNYRSMFKLTSDRVFHWVYGMDTEESRRALIALLNVVLDRKSDPITEVKILNPIEKGYTDQDKETTMDIKCETQSGETIDVEMQSGNLPFYPERSLFYGGRLINSSLEEGKKYDKMKKSIVITFVDGILFRDIPLIHSRFYVREETTGYNLTDRFAMHFIELGKISDDKLVEELTPVEKLGAYMKYCGNPDKENYVSKLIESGEEAVTMSEHVFSKLTEDELARELLDRQQKAAHDRATLIDYYHTQGLKEGLEQGMQIYKLSAQGLDAKSIAEKVGLPEETVIQLLSQ